MPRFIDANEIDSKLDALAKKYAAQGRFEAAKDYSFVQTVLLSAPTVDACSEEQVANIIQQTEKLEAKNKELEKEISWLKSCLNCKIRKECPRHCGKVVHDCDHWEYGDSTVDAVEVVHGRWIICSDGYYPYCSYCEKEPKHGEMTNYCPNCGAKMDGDGND